VGYEGHTAARDLLRARFDGISGIRVWEHRFPVVVPKVGTAVLEVDDGACAGSHRVFPFWPASSRLNTTPGEGISGRLVYVGNGEPRRVPARSLRGQIAVMEVTGDGNWTATANWGARAVICLGSPDENQRDAQSHLSPMAIPFPRFYIPDGDLADALRSDDLGTATVRASGAWDQVEATSFYVLVPASGDGPDPAEASDGRALVIAVQLDGSGAVPELAPSADGGVDVALALEMIEHFADNPPQRPLLFAFLDAQGINQLGVRQFLGSVAVLPRERRTQLREDGKLLEEYSEHSRLVDELAGEQDWVNVFHRDAYKPLHPYLKDEVSRKIVEVETVIQPLRLKLHHMEDGPEKGEFERRVDELARERSNYFAVQLQLVTRKPVGLDNPAIRGLAETLWRRAVDRTRGQLAEHEALMARDRERDRIRTEIADALGLTATDADPEKDDRVPIEFMLGLDISDGGISAGPSLYCRFQFVNERRQATDFTRWLSSVNKDEFESLWPGRLGPAVNLSALVGTDSVDSSVVGDIATLTSVCNSFGIPSATWATLDAARIRVDMPVDRFENLDWSRLTPQLESTFILVRRMAEHRDFTVTTNLTSRWRRIWGTIVDQAPGEPVPRVPMKGYVTTLVSGGVSGGQAYIHYLPPVAGVRRQEFLFSGSDGRFIYEIMPANVYGGAAMFFVQSQLQDEDGRIVRAVDMKKGGKGVSLAVHLHTHNPTPLRAVVFDCVSGWGTNFNDPRFLLALPMVSMLDARRGGEPRRMNLTRMGGTYCFQLEEEMRWQMILRAGVTRNRMALVNMLPYEEARDLPLRRAMRGYEIGDELPEHHLYLAAQDFYRIDEWRIAEYEKAGITSEAIKGLRVRTRELLDEADAALAADSGEDLVRTASGALANEVRAYQTIRDTANDVIRGAIFLLLALAPFAYVMERLLFASPTIYRQLGGIGAIFAVMTGVLWSFHPAFRMSSQPLMIIMAFGIILMSALVISVVFSKFEAGLEEFRSGRAEASGARTSRMGVLTTAIRLGIANMRKRKLRTALTGITIVLITFALLCFTSASRYVGEKEFTIDAEAPFTGVLVRQPANRAMPYEAHDYMRQVLGDERTVVSRFWWSNPWNAQWRVRIYSETSGAMSRLRAALGLDGGEAELTGIDRFCPNWERFAEKGGCYLAREIGDELGVKPGDRILFCGEALEVVGLYESRELDAHWRDLDGTPPRPADYSQVGDEKRNVLNRLNVEEMVLEMESGSGMEPEADLPYLSSSTLIIVPADTLKEMRCNLRSIAAGAGSPEDARGLARSLVKRLAFPIYYGSPEGVRVTATTPLLPKAPKSLLIPLLIAGFIIFNTMLSSIAERRREIYIYTSLGLAPLHVGFLFLAEAVTYGLMGSIFGYVVGQGVATVFSRLGWLGGITLNYSGTQTIAVMMLVIAVVILSSLVPAFLAGKLATPSNEMSWSVPEPQGDLIRDTLPFTATGKTVNGVMTFLLEYLDAHREGSIGNFSTDNLRPVRVDRDGLELMGIESTVWLAPYDLGVRQDIRIVVYPTEDEDVIGIDIELRRGSGQLANWRKLNRVFLGDLRRQLLGWRKLKSDRVLAYIAEAREHLNRAEGRV
jgi:hypothetical protein